MIVCRNLLNTAVLNAIISVHTCFPHMQGVAGPMCPKSKTRLSLLCILTLLINNYTDQTIKEPRKSKHRAPGGTVYKTDSELEETKQAATAVQEGEELEKVRKGRTRRMGVAVKQQSGSVIVKKEDVSESDVELVDTSSRRGTKRKQRAAKEPVSRLYQTYVCTTQKQIGRRLSCALMKLLCLPLYRALQRGVGLVGGKI